MLVTPALACFVLALQPLASGPALGVAASMRLAPNDCCQSDREIKEGVAEQADVLQHGTAAERAMALERLADYKGAEATDLIVTALGDSDPLVADSAQRLLPRLETRGLLKRLRGRDGLKSEDSLIRARVAEAIGRFKGPIDAQDLLRHIKDEDIQLSRMLLWSLERLAQRDALKGKPQRTIKAVRMLTGRGDNDKIRAAAMQVLSQLDPHDGAISLDNLSEGCGLETASCLMDAFVRLETPGFRGAIVRGVSHSNAGVRIRAVDVLMQTGVTRSDLTEMIRQLGVEPRAGVRRRIVTALQFFTGQRLGDEAGPWKTFADGLKPGWSTAETTNGIRERPRAFGDIELLRKLTPTSDRVAVLLDVSASFWTPMPDGYTLADLILPEVESLLGRLDQSGTFFLVPFGDQPTPWSKEPIDATGDNIAEANRFLLEELTRVTPKDQGCNVYAAISRALDFEELDSIVVITGSSSYIGDHGTSSMMATLLEEQSRFRPAIFDFALLGTLGPNASRWSQLAGSRGGRVLQINFQ